MSPHQKHVIQRTVKLRKNQGFWDQSILLTKKNTEEQRVKDSEAINIEYEKLYKRSYINFWISRNIPLIFKWQLTTAENICKANDKKDQVRNYEDPVQFNNRVTS